MTDASKEDLANLRAELAAVKGELKEDIAGVRVEIAAVKGELKEDLAGVRVEIAGVGREIDRLGRDMYRTAWVMGVGIIVVLGILVRLLS